ncbi:phage antirepressor N-terminal domain-containing protein [Methylobacter sp.]|uniref:phage antirepressor N-terminal domain-containing protein n=1 Tax=Methylobacter sp. TaxID=2051955 RepID=UPI002488D60E|nr:phage antirepressor N-terminal domain-containing protein [Methylobacter sp.]MDI1279268.1 phage antirepressor N-terminal domain-containing protein [Methylobacter sp.]
MNNLITIPFHQQTIIAIEHDGKPYVAMKPIVENMGLAWQVQHRKITKKFSKGITILVTPSAGGLQETLCLPLAMLPGFLYTISPSKVKPELRALIEAYQDECTEVLFNHFMSRVNAEHTVYNQLLNSIFAKHPQWRETLDLYHYGFSQREIASLQGKHRRSVQRMLSRVRRAGIELRPSTRVTPISAT